MVADGVNPSKRVAIEINSYFMFSLVLNVRLNNLKPKTLERKTKLAVSVDYVRYNIVELAQIPDRCCT